MVKVAVRHLLTPFELLRDSDALGDIYCTTRLTFLISLLLGLDLHIAFHVSDKGLIVSLLIPLTGKDPR